MKKTNGKVLSLPKALFGKDGFVNNEIVHDVLRVTPQAGHLAKYLCKWIGGPTRSNFDDRVKLIAENLQSPGFRIRWYSEIDTKQFSKRGWYPFCRLMYIWLISKNSFFNPDENITISDSFLPIKGWTFIGIEAIGEILDQAEKKKIDPGLLALYLWAFAEVEAWSALTAKSQTIDFEFANQLEGKVQTSYSSQVLAGFFPLNGNSSGDESRSHPESDKSDTSGEKPRPKPKSTSIFKKGNSSDQQHSPKSSFDCVSESLEALSGRHEDCERTIDQIKNLLNEKNPISNTQFTIDLLAKARTLKKETETLKKFQTKYIKQFESTIEQIQITQLSKIIFKPVAEKVEGGLSEWFEFQRQQLKSAYLFECELIKLNFKQVVLKSHGEDINLPDSCSQMGQAVSLAKKVTEQASQRISVFNKLEKMQTLVSGIDQSCLNPKLLQYFSDKDFLESLLHSNEEGAVDSCLIGLALRSLLDAQSLSINEASSVYLELFEQSDNQGITALSFLSRRQLEEVWKKNNSLHPWIQLCILIAVLELGHKGEDVALQLLYWQPLQKLHDFANKNKKTKGQTNINRTLAVLEEGISNKNVLSINGLHQLLKLSKDESISGADKDLDDLGSRKSSDRFSPEEISWAREFEAAVFSLRAIPKGSMNYPFANKVSAWLENIEEKPISIFCNALFPEKVDPEFLDSKCCCIGDLPVHYPGCFENCSLGLEFSWREYFLDALKSWSGCVKMDSVISDWIHDEKLEVILAFCDRLPDHEYEGYKLSLWVKQKISKRVSEFKSRLKKIKSQSQVLSAVFLESIEPDLLEASEALRNREFLRFENIVKTLEELLKTELEGLGGESERKALVLEIQQLGGTCDPKASLHELNKYHNQLWDKLKTRVAHIEPVERLLDMEWLPDKVQIEIQKTIQHLRLPKNLPTSARSKWLSEVFEEAFSPLLPILSQSPGMVNPKVFSTVCESLVILSRIISHVEWSTKEPVKEEVLLIEAGRSINNPSEASELLSILQEHATQIGISVRQDITQPSAEKLGLFPEENPNEDTIEIQSNLDPSTLRGLLVEALVNADLTDLEKKHNATQKPPELIKSRDWLGLARYSYSHIKGFVDKAQQPDHKNDTHLSDCALALSMLGDSPSFIDAEIRTSILQFIESTEKSSMLSVSKFRSKDANTRIFGFIVAQWLALDVCSDEVHVLKARTFNELAPLLIRKDGSSRIDYSGSLWIARVLGRKASEETGVFQSVVLQHLWELGSSERTWGAEFRAWLLWICEIGGCYGALSFLLRQDPIGLENSRAKLACQLLRGANDSQNLDFLHSFLRSESLKNGSKPLALFSDKVISQSENEPQKPASVLASGIWERTAPKTWSGVIEIEPLTKDPPNILSIQLPKESGITFENGSTSRKFEGPFLEKQFSRVILKLPSKSKGHIPLEAVCTVRTIQESTLEFVEIWKLELGSEEEFQKPTPKDIEKAFDGFPQRPMRGEEYVPRDEDEKTIEEVLFDSERAGSLWITSPRRSGKTTMLYRILDEYSYRKNRDDIVLYMTLSSGFETVFKFNRWIWSQVVNGPDNMELEKLTGSLGHIRTELDFELETDIFINNLAEKILKHANEGAHVYLVFDEIDQFAQMYLASQEGKNVSLEIMWQLRHLVMNREKIGIIFSGSHVARRFFVEDPEAPFFNSITSLRLTPFKVDTMISKDRTCQVVQPNRLRQIYDVPDDTLRHMLWITNGIPYYMKLLAGATYAVATQSRIYPTDVNEGLRKMFRKETGIRTLDMLENPGEDELRTLYAQNIHEKILTKALLLSVAHINSPVRKQGVNIGTLWNEKSPLVVKAGLTKKTIEPALQRALEMGFLKPFENKEHSVEFTIPILGESLRERFTIQWAGIAGILEEIAQSEKER